MRKTRGTRPKRATTAFFRPRRTKTPTRLEIDLLGQINATPATTKRITGAAASREYAKTHDKLCLAVRKYLWLRFRVKLYKTDAGGGDGRVSSGFPDLCGVLPPYGVFLGVEVKTGDAVLRANQKAVHEEIKGAGGEVLVVHSLEEAEFKVGELLRKYERDRNTEGRKLNG